MVDFKTSFFLFNNVFFRDWNLEFLKEEMEIKGSHFKIIFLHIVTNSLNDNELKLPLQPRKVQLFI